MVALLLVAASLGYALIQALRSRGDAEPGVPPGQRTGRLLITGVALSIDNLAVGDMGEMLGGGVLIGVGIAIATGVL